MTVLTTGEAVALNDEEERRCQVARRAILCLIRGRFETPRKGWCVRLGVFLREPMQVELS